MREAVHSGTRQAGQAPAGPTGEAAAAAAPSAAAPAEPASLARAERLGHRITGAVQRKITFVDTLLPPPRSGIHTRLSWRLDSLRDKGETVPELSWSELEEGVVLVQESPIDYGLVDFNDDQHIVLLAYEMRKQLMRRKEGGERLVKRPDKVAPEPETQRIEEQEAAVVEEQKKWQERRERTPRPERTFRTVYLGAGASIAYEIATRSPNVKPEESLIVGTVQPWAGTRGPGVVAHPEHMITPMRRFLGDTRSGVVDDVFLERGKFSELIEQVLAASGMARVGKPVVLFDRSPVGLYWIWVEGEDDPYYAEKVVAGIGVGAHTSRGIDEPLIAREEGQVGAKQVMDMDLFTKVAGKIEKTVGGVRIGSEESDKSKITIVLSGGNGAIDVAFDALNKGYKVHWIVGNSGAKFLPGFFNLAAYLPFLRSLKPTDFAKAGFKADASDTAKGKVDKEIERVKKLLVPLYKAQRNEMFRGVVERFLPETTRFEGIYFGRVGPDAVKAEAGKVQVTIDQDTLEGDLMVYGVGQDNKTFELLKDVMAGLVPERDVSGRFGAPGETTIGLSSGDKSLRVVGATAFRLAPSVKPSKEQVVAAQQAIWDAYEEVKRLSEEGLFGNFRSLWLAHWEVEEALGTAGEKKAQEEFTKAAKTFDAFIETLDRSLLSGEQATAVDRFLGALGGARTRMEPVISSLPGNVLINDQLTATRSQTEASRGFLPYDIGRHANFLTDDRTALAVHIAARYPKLADKDDGEWPGEYAEKIVASRSREVAGGPDFAALLPDVPPKERSVPPYGRKFQAAWRDLLEAAEKTA